MFHRETSVVENDEPSSVVGQERDGDSICQPTIGNVGSDKVGGDRRLSSSSIHSKCKDSGKPSYKLNDNSYDKEENKEEDDDYYSVQSDSSSQNKSDNDDDNSLVGNLAAVVKKKKSVLPKSPKTMTTPKKRKQPSGAANKKGATATKHSKTSKPKGKVRKTPPRAAKT